MNVDQIRSLHAWPSGCNPNACVCWCVCVFVPRQVWKWALVCVGRQPARSRYASVLHTVVAFLNGRPLSPTSMEASENYPVSCWGQQTCRRNHRYKRRSYLQQRAVKKGDKIIWGRRDSLSLFMIKELWNHDLFSAGGFKPTVLLVGTFRLRESCFNILLWTDVMI